MEENRERPEDDDRSVSRILDDLEEARWTFVGEVRHLVDPNDSELLGKLAEECERRLEAADTDERRERLTVIQRRLRAAALLNDYLPMVAIEDLLARTGEANRTRGGAGRRKRSKRGNTGSPVPGFEAYHARVTGWIDDKGLSQSALAQHLNVDPSYLSRAIRGERKNRDLFLKIEELTGVAAPFVPDSEEDARAEADPEATLGEGGKPDPGQVN